MSTKKKSISESFFLFIINNFKIVILIFILPQIILFFYERTVESENCLGSVRIIVSKSVTNNKIFDEVFIENLDVQSLNNTVVFGRNIVVKGNKKIDCENTYIQLKKRTKIINKMIEDFYFTKLTDEERSRFAGPLLFNIIGGKKIQFAKLTPLDLEIFKNKEQTKRKVYLFILSIIILIVYYTSQNFRKFKNYL